jgi:hypothetical protein
MNPNEEHKSKLGELVRLIDVYEFHLRPGFKSAIFRPGHMWI